MASITEQNTIPDVSLVTNSAPLGASNDITRQSYPAQTFESFSALSSDLHPETLHSIELANPAVFASIIDRTPMLLDSACTNHIVKDKHYFFTYDASGATDVTTANAGKLSTQASGYFRTPIEGTDKFLVSEMFDCLHARMLQPISFRQVPF
ncbi:hypothetical protein BT96DRAFT_1007634 [Gymnopus androsaceus JB14]|uniref:Retrovirus-related Pol polyprotein from transposon TNT 1-94-like beta-barrel domain-containing protein n=1 Tax=Gymnopus androsaceus JB14 TaxID=1447944 RepID=A0A6A4GHB2_9AGAR|nr:hypothetical protein BT96DRAFT_1007634 [Gymnopus androsaceus JB14]